jgi:hypothetical protein
MMMKELLSLIICIFNYAIFDLTRFAASEDVSVTRRKVLSIIGFVVIVNNRMQDLIKLA